MRKYFISAWLVLSVLYSCKNDKKPITTTEPGTPAVKLKVPAFNPDSAYAYVKQQVSFGARVPGTPAHRKCGEWIIAKCKELGATVSEQNFSGQTYTGLKFDARNIIASYNPSGAPRILVLAHWDSRFIADQDPDKAKQKNPVMGADDGASGVGVLLELARQLKMNPIRPIGVDLFFADAEDQGEDSGGDSNSWCLGTQYWAKNKHVPGYQAKYAILLDMVGAKTPRFSKEGTSIQYAPALVEKVWSQAQRMGYGNYYVNESSSPTVDDHYFINSLAHIPAIDIVNRPDANKYPPHHHTTADQLNIIDPESLKASGQVVLAVMYREANGDF